MVEEGARLRALRGTYDLLPPQSWTAQGLERLALDAFAGAGYAPVETPAFEHTEVFSRGVGEASEVVTKQMYTFTDRGGRSLTLKPEGTAPVMRAVLEHGLDRGPLPVKLAYADSFFRQERPQKGRHRQLHQVGIEAIGADDPAVDAEVIEIGTRYLADAVGGARLVLNSIGHLDRSCRLGYLEVLVEYLERRSDDLAPEDRERAGVNPLRAFDSKESQTIAALQGAPLISDHLCAACKEHFESVQTLLHDVGVAYDLEPRLVRGLDYYTRTAWEWVSADLGAQTSVGGGGRYDGLSEQLGGPPLPGIGFAIGLDRLLLLAESREPPRPVAVYAVALGDEARRSVFSIVTQLRASGVGADLDFAGRAMKGQMKDAARSGARWAVIVGADEIASGRATVKDLRSGEQEEVPFDRLVERLRP